MVQSAPRFWYTFILFILSAGSLAAAWYFVDSYLLQPRASSQTNGYVSGTPIAPPASPSVVSPSSQDISPLTDAPQSRQIIIGKIPITVELALTPQAQSQGLSRRASLAPDTGMLFVYRSPGRYSFWMKDMRFSLDFIWIDQDGRVADIAEAVGPETFPKAVQPSVPVPYVLEVNAGFVKKYGIKIGDMSTITSQN